MLYVVCCLLKLAKVCINHSVNRIGGAHCRHPVPATPQGRIRISESTVYSTFYIG